MFFLISDALNSIVRLIEDRNLFPYYNGFRALLLQICYVFFLLKKWWKSFK